MVISTGFLAGTGLEAVSAEGIATQLTIVPNRKISTPNLTDRSRLFVVAAVATAAGAGNPLAASNGVCGRK